MMIATLETLVACSAGMNATMPSVESEATSQPPLPNLTRSRSPDLPSISR